MPAPLLLLLSLKAFLSPFPHFLLSDTVCTTLVSISLLLTPSHLLSYQTDVRLDRLSLHLARLIGLLLLSSSLHTHRAFTTRTLQERAAASSSRALTALILFLCAVHARHHYPAWNFRFAHLTATGAACWFAPHFYFALSTVSTATPEPRGVVALLFLDYFMTVAVGLACLAFPHAVLRTLSDVPPNAVSVTLARVLAAILIGLAAVSQAGMAYASLEAKRHVHLTRLLTAGPVLILLCLGWAWRCFNDVGLFVGAGAAIVWGANSALGCAATVFIQRARDAARASNKEINKLSPS
ncbi:unnamed protein product [Chondrus crispus]|uniref:Uncharacterized protein n=1 Tax=Chondrus crispus TaxID=2769 RepID=R7QB71_CHOCR|nr:unnamed protein product [Chondrus crispus]CDF34988.1 unnamed protein product [Chondrus crispus]|eukprot:XP_005714807.1 unnamed protein product [Chondrus crispus]